MKQNWIFVDEFHHNNNQEQQVNLVSSSFNDRLKYTMKCFAEGPYLGVESSQFRLQFIKTTF